jgi:four helix bundle protein
VSGVWKGSFCEYQKLSRFGSLAELETHIQIAERLHYINDNQTKQELDRTAEIGRMLNGLRKSIEKKT